MDCKNLKELENALRDKIDIGLLTDVISVVSEVMEDHIIRDVYDVYSPTYYNRRGANGGLADMDNINSSVKNETLIVENNTLGNSYINGMSPPVSQNNGKEITGIIETGQGYDVKGWEYDGVPRPFISNTREDLKSNKYHVKALKNALKKMGLEVK